MASVKLSRDTDQDGRRQILVDGQLIGHFTTTGKSGLARFTSLNGLKNTFHNVLQMRRTLERDAEWTANS